MRAFAFSDCYRDAVSTAVEPPESPPGPRAPWGRRTNRVVLGALIVLHAWLFAQTIRAGALALLFVPLGFAIAALGALAIEIVVLAPFRRYPGIAPWTRHPAVAIAVVALALALVVIREVGVVRIDLSASQFRTSYITPSRLGGAVDPAAAFQCGIVCHGDDVCWGMGDAISDACDSTAPAHLVIDLWVDDPFCYTPLVKVVETRFEAVIAGPGGRLHFEGNTTGRVIGESSCRSARRQAGANLGRALVAAFGEAVQHPDKLLELCADRSMQTSCEVEWSPP